jgi:branched-chain amino acid transport system substrate-binding protein
MLRCTHRRVGTALLTVGMIGAGLAACGTRLPDKAFIPSQVVVVQPGTGTDPAVTDPVNPADIAALGNEIRTGTTGTIDTVNTGTSGTGSSGTAGSIGSTGTTGGAGPGATRSSATTTGKGATVSKATTGTTGAAKLGSATASKAPVGPNTASDTGVSAQSITVGNIVSAGGIFGTEQFGSTKYGVQAFFADLNSRGGINGRKVTVNLYNDNGDGGQNVNAVNQAIDNDKVFAFVGNNIYAYSGAATVSAKAVPDIGGQPIDNSYYEYKHLYNVLGYNGPQDNQNFGFNNMNYGTPDYGHYFVDKLGVTKVGLVFYDIASSRRGASRFGQSFSQIGLPVKEYPVNLGLPNFSNTVAQMQADGIDIVLDAMDANGNAKLCQAMEGNANFINQVKAKVSSISAWSQRIPTEFKQTPKCRELIYTNGQTAAYSETSNPEVATFRAAMKKYFPSREQLLSQWTFEGWIAGQEFLASAKACGVDLTRKCLEDNLTRPGYVFNVQGATSGFSWYARAQSDFDGKTLPHACYAIARWNDQAGTFVSSGALQAQCTDNQKYCGYTLS